MILFSIVIVFILVTYIIHRVSRYDIHGKRLFESNDKFYFEDHGLRNAQTEGTREGDIEKVVENIVYQHLISLGYKVNVGQLQAGEIDFVCTKKAGTKRIYIQAAYLIANSFNSEFAARCFMTTSGNVAALS